MSAWEGVDKREEGGFSFFNQRESAGEEEIRFSLFLFLSGLFLLVYSLPLVKSHSLVCGTRRISSISLFLYAYRGTHREMPTPLMEQSFSINIVVYTTSLIL